MLVLGHLVDMGRGRDRRGVTLYVFWSVLCITIMSNLTFLYEHSWCFISSHFLPTRKNCGFNLLFFVFISCMVSKFSILIKTWIQSVGVLDQQTYQGVPEVVDCAVRIVIGRPRTRRYAQGHGTRDLYRFGSPRWRALRPVWGIKYGALRLVLGWDPVPG
jgi:hypothetical protein